MAMVEAVQVFDADGQAADTAPSTWPIIPLVWRPTAEDELARLRDAAAKEVKRERAHTARLRNKSAATKQLWKAVRLPAVVQQLEQLMVPLAWLEAQCQAMRVRERARDNILGTMKRRMFLAKAEAIATSEEMWPYAITCSNMLRAKLRKGERASATLNVPHC